MTVLSSRDLININYRNASQPLSPFLDDLYKPNGALGPSYGLSSAGYDVRLSDEFASYNPPENDSGEIDPTNPESLACLEQIVTRHYKQTRYVLGPGEFVLGVTEETFDMPDDVVGHVTDKSTWARLGISVFNTIIEPGWSGRLVLEIRNNNVWPVVLTAGVGIAQVIFHKLSSRPVKTYRERAGKYEGQTGVTLPR